MFTRAREDVRLVNQALGVRDCDTAARALADADRQLRMLARRARKFGALAERVQEAHSAYQERCVRLPPRGRAARAKAAAKAWLTRNVLG